MKIKMIAAILAAGITLPVAAQQVTVYGVLDQAVRFNSPTVGASTTNMVSGSILTSRLGFRGEEDLGNGLKLNFILEGRLDGSNGAMGSGSNFFSRESSVSLSSPAGTLTLGRTDTSGAEGVDIFAGFGNFQNFALNRGAAPLSADREATVRYTSPTFNGVRLQVGRSMLPGTPETDSVSATYVKGNLGLTAGMDKAGADNYKAYGGRYNFGFASVGAMYGKRESTNTEATALSARVPLSNGFAAHGSYRTTKNPTSEVNQTAVGLSKSLSKRTSLNAVYQDTDRGTSAGNFFQVGMIHSF
jgi:predicted porin